MATAHVQGSVTSFAGGTAATASLTNTPANGNLVVAGALFANSISNLIVGDGNGNSYAITPNSPSPNVSGTGNVYIAYWRTASRPSKLVNFGWTTSQLAIFWLDEFSFTGNLKFDTDAGASGGPGTTINTPTITPTFGGSLLYSTAGSTGNISAPAAGATLGAWTGAGGAITNGNMAEYILSQAASNRAVNYTTSSANWTSMVAAFMIDQAGHIQLEGGTGNVELENLSGDIALET